MSSGAITLTALAAAAVFVVLAFGLWNMGRPGNASNLSQKLMRWRVALQFATLVIAMGLLYLSRQ